MRPKSASTMNPRIHPAAKFLMRYYVELLAVLAILFVLQTGLVPFDFFQDQPTTGSTVLFGAATDRLTLPDVIFNGFLYIPVGLLLHCCLFRRCGDRRLALPLAIALAAALSGAVEWLQAYSPARISSIIDFTANVTGACIGACISHIAGWILPKLVGAALFEFHELPQAALVKVYCFALVIAAAMPFSFSFDSVRLKQSLKNARLVPFSAVTAYEAAADQALAAGDHWHRSHAKWQSMKRWSRWTAECVAFAVLVWLMQPVLRGQYNFSARAAAGLTWWLCGAFAVGLSLLQLPILTRGFDTTDILFRLLGVEVGLVTRSVYFHVRERLTPQRRSERRHNLARIGCAATLIYIVYAGVIPLTINTEHGGPEVSIGSKGFLPFFAYFVTRFDLMMDDVMEKFVSYALFAALLAACWARVANLATSSRVLAVTTVGVAISVVIEAVQMFIPVRVTSLTDPILAACGCVVGVLGREHAVAFYRFATTHQMLGPKEPQAEREVPARLPSTDTLIASLTEPRPDAPVEPPQRSKPIRSR